MEYLKVESVESQGAKDRILQSCLSTQCPEFSLGGGP